MGGGWFRRTLLAVATVLVLVGPVLGLAYAAQTSIARDLEQRSAHDRVRTAELASRLVSHYLAVAAQDISYVATHEELQKAFRADDRATIAKHLAETSAAWPAFQSMLAIDARGTEIVVAARGAVAGARVTGVPELSGSGIGQDRSQRDYFVGAMASTAEYVSEAYRSAAPGGAVLVAISKTLRDRGGPVGVVAGTLAPSDLIAAITESLNGSSDITGRQIIVVDKADRVVASTDPARASLAAAGLPDTERALEGEHSSRTLMLDGHERVVTSVPIDGSRWVLYVVDDPTVVLAVERGLNRTVGWAAATMIVVALVGAAVVVLVYGTLARRRDELSRSRSALEDANADLALANQHKSEFLSSVSHELRTPLNSILGFTDLLDEQLHEGITERQRRYFRNVRTAGEHLLELINDVLDLSRVESGRIELRTEPISLEQLLEPVIANIRRSATERGIAFEGSVSGGAVLVDPARMRQILYNLGSNGVKFTKPGGTVSCRAWIDGDMLAVDVRDSGIGIPVDRQDRVFGMFERVNEDRSDAKGTGLGLALSKLLVELHGGTIGFESVEDAGSTFRVRIPGVATPTRETGALSEAASAHPAG